MTASACPERSRWACPERSRWTPSTEQSWLAGGEPFVRKLGLGCCSPLRRLMFSPMTSFTECPGTFCKGCRGTGHQVRKGRGTPQSRAPIHPVPCSEVNEGVSWCPDAGKNQRRGKRSGKECATRHRPETPLRRGSIHGRAFCLLPVATMIPWRQP